MLSDKAPNNHSIPLPIHLSADSIENICTRKGNRSSLMNSFSDLPPETFRRQIFSH